MSDNIATILGYTLFALSELLPLLPMPANGFLHSIAIGLKNSFSNKPISTDIEIAQNLLISRPNMPNIISTLEGNHNLTNSIKLLNDNPQLLAQINKLANDKNLRFINTLLINNPDIINQIKGLIINTLNNTSLPQPQPQPQQQQPQQLSLPIPQQQISLPISQEDNISISL
jgi:hypothetical protein